MTRFLIFMLGYGITLTSTSSNVMSIYHHPLSNPIKEAPVASSLIIQKPAYQTVFSLGDTFNHHGLEIAFDDGENLSPITDFFISGDNPYTLGEQLITVSYQGLQATYPIKVTNEAAIFFPLVAEDIFISEYVRLNDSDLALELFNGTNSAVNLGDYSISITEEKVFGLNNVDLAVNETYVIASNTSKQEILGVAQQIEADFSWVVGDMIELKKGQVPIDVINTIEDNTSNCINGICSLDNSVLARSNKHFQKTTDFNKREWHVFGSDLSRLGQHHFASANLTYEQQAKAFGEYVMYGAGMFAAGRVEEAYQQLKEEYGFMHINAKAFFIQNPNYEIEGINEEGKLDKSTFKEASGRIAVLASRNGEPSFLPHSSSFSSDNSTIKNAILIALIAMTFVGFYLLLKFKRIIR